MMTHKELSRSRNSLVVYVGLSSLGGHIDDDANVTFVFVEFDLKLFKMKRTDVIRSGSWTNLIPVNIHSAELVDRAGLFRIRSTRHDDTM